ncbi:phospholipid phosphatase 2-like isoform X2 [Dipodomys merriami]|uniref:phospholipid phosphatase 2-like isoform X2 n=1 Tax=Dipodomys merriami TaxID=94247 RepID=UPI00385576B7
MRRGREGRWPLLRSDLRGSLPPVMELNQKVSTEGSPKTWTSQRSARFTNSDVTLASGVVHSPPGLHSRPTAAPPPHTVKAVGRGREPPPPPLLSSRTSKVLVALDVFCVILVSTPTLLVEKGLVAPHFQGFFCNDTSIKYPQVSHYIMEDSAITTIGFLIFIFMISLGEMILVWSLPLGSQAMVTTYVTLVYKQLGTFIFGAMASSSLTSIAQMTTGHLRPHFLAVCLPDPTTFSCESSYIANYTCTGNPSDVLEARKSFYSKQASFGMYCMVYLAARHWGTMNRLLRPTIQCFFLLLALFLGYSQTQNHRHHPLDTVTGFLQGAVMALWVAFYIAGLSTSQATSKPSSPRG